MRSYLIRCFEQGRMDCFPVLREQRIPFNSSIKYYEREAIYCVCRMPDDKSETMIECSMCKEWHYGSCVGLSNVDEYSDKRWLCGSCGHLL